METYDFMSQISKTEIPVLDIGLVKLIDFSPRICPVGYNPEFRIAQAARVSFGKGLKTVEEDTRLVEYLYKHFHTSPFEMCSVTLALKIPKAVAIQLYRHRTSTFSHFNEFSQRYAECTDEIGVYNPLRWKKEEEFPGIRTQDTVNKQGSKEASVEQIERIKVLMEEANHHQERIHSLYHAMIAEGCAKEIARFWLPMSEYTIMYVQYDLNNLLKMLSLRDEAHTQYETQVVAKAISDLCSQIFPNVFREYQSMRSSITLTPSEVTAIQTGNPLETASKSARAELEHKRTLLTKS